MAHTRRMNLVYRLPKSVVDSLRASALAPEPEPDAPKPAAPPHISHSQMSMYLRCPAQWRFRYVLGLKERPKVSLSIGKGGHEALEFNSKTKIRTGEDAPLEAVLQRASDRMDYYLGEMPPSEIEKDVEPGSTKDKFIAATKVYRVRDAPNVYPLGAEVEFNLDLNQYLPEPAPVPIRIVNGKIDLVYNDTTTHVAVWNDEAVAAGVEDHKYAVRRKQQLEVDLSPQLTLYAAYLRSLTGRWPTKVGLRQMHPGTTKDAPDSIQMLRSPEAMSAQALDRRLARLVHQYRQVEAGIAAGAFPAVDDPITCSWCGFRERCQMSLVDDVEAATIRASTPSPIV